MSYSRFFLLCLFVFCYNTLFAQQKNWNIEVLTALNTNIFPNNAVGNSRNSPSIDVSFLGGLRVAYNFSPSWSLQTGVLYTKQTHKDSFQNRILSQLPNGDSIYYYPEQNSSYTYFQMPLHLRYSLGSKETAVRPYFLAGISWGVVGVQSETEYVRMQKTVSTNNFLKEQNYFLNYRFGLGLNYVLSEGFKLGAETLFSRGQFAWTTWQISTTLGYDF